MKRTAWVLALLFYASLLPWAQAAPPNARFHNITSDNGAITGFRSIGNPAFTDNLTLYSNDLITGGPWVDVRKFGASTSATTSANRIAIQAAIDNATVFSPRKTVFFPDLYQTDAAVTVSTTNLTLRGANNQCGIWNRGSGKAVVFTHGYNTMEDIYIKGNNVASPGYDNAASGIEVNASAEAQVYFHNVISGYHKGDGVRILGGVYEITVDKSCVFASNSGHGMNTVSVTGNGNHTSVFNSSLSNNLKSGLSWGGASQLNVHGNIFQSNGRYGVEVDATLNTNAIAIRGNYFEDDTLGHILATVASGKSLGGMDVGVNNFVIGGTPTAGDNVYAAVKFAGAGTVSSFVYSPSNKDPGQDVLDGGGILDSTCWISPTLASNSAGNDFTGGYSLKNWGSARSTGTYNGLGAPAQTRACLPGITYADNTYKYDCVTSGNWRRTANDNTTGW